MPGSLSKILPLLTPDVSKVQFSLVPIDADGRQLGEPAPQLRDFQAQQTLVDEICKTGCYVNPPTSGNVFRRDIFEMLESADYDWFVDGVTLFAAPFFGSVVSLSEPLGCYRLHGANASGVGLRPDVSKLTSDIERFVARLSHLRRILEVRGLEQRPPRPQDTFYYRERSLYLSIAEGRRPSASEVRGALQSLRRQPMSSQRKIALAALSLAGLMCPPKLVARLLAYRLKPSNRSAFGVIRMLASIDPS